MMNPDVFENMLTQCRVGVDVCVNQLTGLNDAAARVTWSHARVNESKLALNALHQAAAKYPEAAAEQRHKDVVASSEKALTACIENHELHKAVFGELKALAKRNHELVINALNTLNEHCLNDQHRASVAAMLAELTACQAALPD